MARWLCQLRPFYPHVTDPKLGGRDKALPLQIPLCTRAENHSQKNPSRHLSSYISLARTEPFVYTTPNYWQSTMGVPSYFRPITSHLFCLSTLPSNTGPEWQFWYWRGVGFGKHLSVWAINCVSRSRGKVFKYFVDAPNIKMQYMEQTEAE